MRVIRWLGGWLGDVRSKYRRTHMRMRRLAKTELLRRAAECFARAGMADQATQIFRRLGDEDHVGRLSAEQHDWRQVAESLYRRGQFRQASEHFQRLGDYEQAAECLWRGSEFLAAGWLWVDRTDQVRQAARRLAELSFRQPYEQWLRELILARCETRLGDPVGASTRLLRVLQECQATDASCTMEDKRSLFEWSLVVADSTGRPDLMSSCFATGVLLHVSDASRRWREWTTEALGGTPAPSFAAGDDLDEEGGS